jgi:hypothetical protein
MQDSNPERRNLTVLSVAIIIYYFAEGNVDPSHLRLGLLDMHFNEPGNLVIAMWVMLLWFLYRHFVVNYEVFCNELKKDFMTLNVNFIGALTIGKTELYKHNFKNTSQSHDYKNYQFDLNLLKTKVISFRGRHESLSNHLPMKHNLLALSLYAILVLLYSTLARPQILGFFGAPILAVIAILLRLTN